MSEHMDHDQDPGFDRELDQTLRRLPYPKAPAGLAAAVLARLEAERDPAWWHRPILAWPLAARVIGVGALLALAGGVAYVAGGTGLGTGLGEEATVGTSSSLFGWAALVVQLVASLGSAFEACVEAIPTTVWWFLGAALAGAYLGCLAVGTFIYRRLFSHPS